MTGTIDRHLNASGQAIRGYVNANLAIEVRKGITQNAQLGYGNGGTPLYGYRTEQVAFALGRKRQRQYGFTDRVKKWMLSAGYSISMLMRALNTKRSPAT
ncbi:hypothetical protein [Paenibacillus sp. TAF43_2]|uniref:hypothetical protein n=1 Tax=Paenibacillus sp. TAF43_2 TaxID=3233069 RepID=UPI003F9D883C